MPILTIERLHPELGARVTGVDLRAPLPSAAVQEIRAAIDAHSFLHFPGQAFGDEYQLAFTKALGEPEANHVILGEEGRVSYFGTIGNVQADGTSSATATRRPSS